MFNIYLAIYVIVSIGIIAMGTMKLYNQSQTLGAAIYCIGVMLVCYIYGIRWFGPDALLSDTPVSWPPTINTCPDYLTHYTRIKTDGTKEPTCIDLIGVAKGTTLKKFVTDYTGIVPTEDTSYFSLKTTSNDPATKNNELCFRAIGAGLTWEGITNGESCITASGLSNPTDPTAAKKCP